MTKENLNHIAFSAVKGSPVLPYYEEIQSARDSLYEHWYKQWAAEEYYYTKYEINSFGNPNLPYNLTGTAYWLLVSNPDFDEKLGYKMLDEWGSTY